MTGIPPRPFATPAAKTSRAHEVPKELRDLLWRRSGGACELCGVGLPRGFDVHHRKRRSQGGADTAENTVALHRLCHNRIHGHVTWAEQVGFLLRSHQTPSRVRLALHGEAWVRLTSAGTYTHVDGERS